VKNHVDGHLNSWPTLRYYKKGELIETFDSKKDFKENDLLEKIIKSSGNNYVQYDNCSKLKNRLDELDKNHAENAK
jgi:hypothetical protein